MTNNPTDDELLPCPFCGGHAALVRNDLDERNSYGREAYVKCGKCGARSASFFHDRVTGYANRSTADPKAIKAWNTRPLTKESRV